MASDTTDSFGLADRFAAAAVFPLTEPATIQRPESGWKTRYSGDQMKGQYGQEMKMAYQLPIAGELSDSGDLVFNLVQVFENARFDVESDREKAKASIAKISSLFGLDLMPAAPGSKDRSGNGKLARWQVLRLQAFVDNQIDRSVSILEMSRFVRLSPSHFSRAFKKTFDETPHNYILRRRVAHAKHLLVSSNLPLNEIALSCGFADLAHLCKTFRKRVGDTPTNWRKFRLQVISTTYSGFSSGVS